MKKTATFGAGGFWGVELQFSQLPGVVSTSVGFMGGEVPQPSYLEICSGLTGHTEVVQIEYDSEVVSYDNLLDLFWTIHDPTKPEALISRQFRSVIFYHDKKQLHAAINAKEELDNLKIWRFDIQTAIEPAATFYKADSYHQQYMQKRGIKIACF